MFNVRKTENNFFNNSKTIIFNLYRLPRSPSFALGGTNSIPSHHMVSLQINFPGGIEESRATNLVIFSGKNNSGGSKIIVSR